MTAYSSTDIVREAFADNRADFLLENSSPEAGALARRVRELRDARRDAVQKISEAKGYNTPVLAMMERIELLRSVVRGRGIRIEGTPGYARLLAELQRAKRERVAALHDDDDVRRIFNEYLDQEKPIKEACRRAPGVPEQ